MRKLSQHTVHCRSMRLCSFRPARVPMLTMVHHSSKTTRWLISIFIVQKSSHTYSVQGEDDGHRLKGFYLRCMWLFLYQCFIGIKLSWKYYSGFYTTDALWTDNWEKRDRHRNSEADLLTGNVVLLLTERVQVLERSNYGWFLAASENCRHSVEAPKMDSLGFRAQFCFIFCCMKRSAWVHTCKNIN